MPTWDERFASGSYPTDPDPSPVLDRYVDAFPDGRALDVATGTGRNAVFLAERGYEVDGLDQSREGLRIARENARERGVGGRFNPVQADVDTYEFPEAEYAVVTVSFYRPMDRLPDITAALEPGGVLFVQHHLRSTDEYETGPSTDRYRFAANELLHAALDLTVLHYSETTEERDDGRRSAIAQVVARNSHGHHQTYPEVDP
ncbi:class I SAM-dependent methyltransferase [Halorarius halobius]|uniref:class I SAM-dependent methyltransferase n=1 Tax=Halorarius halobius TaxID=2962671 RepID=UPI0020CE05D8|nr:class I SAM-dependent methyltransferase [Halorarius halobius]